MADDLSGAAVSPEGPPQKPQMAPREPEPPPPLSIRVKPRGPRGLNKPAIVALVGGSAALVLILSATGLGSSPGGKADEKPPGRIDRHTDEEEVWCTESRLIGEACGRPLGRRLRAAHHDAENGDDLPPIDASCAHLHLAQSDPAKGG